MAMPNSRLEDFQDHEGVIYVDSKTSTETASSGPLMPLGWPITPQRIASHPLRVMADLLLLLPPLAFIALAAVAYELDGTPPSERGELVKRLILLGPTLFPLVFTALGSRSLKKIALWRAERGTTLGTLEHLNGSQSLVGTVGHAFTLHSLNFLSLVLLVFWSLSPLGGQSALRLIHSEVFVDTSDQTIYYVNPDAPSEFSKESYNEDMFNRVNAVVMSTLITVDTQESAPVDLWKHPKVPRIEALETDEEKLSPDRPWYTVNRSQNITYASLTGVNVLNLPRSANASYSVPYEYLYFACSLFSLPGMSTHPVNATEYADHSTRYVVQYLNELASARPMMLESGNHYTGEFPQFFDTGRSYFMFTKGNYSIPEALLYGSANLGGGYFMFECPYKSVRVEAEISCHKDSCHVERIRRDLSGGGKKHVHNSYAAAHDGYTNRYMIRHLAFLGGEKSLFRRTPVDMYLYGNSPWGVDEIMSTAPPTNWTSYINEPNKAAAMSRRLTAVLNTFWDASKWPVAITRDDPYGLSSLNKTSSEPYASMTMNKTDATISWEVHMYRVNISWVASLLVCSIVLLLLGIFSTFLSLKITAPDIFDYVSSFTRDNPFVVDVPKGGSTLDGAKRARLLRDLKVQLGDTDADGETGYIAMRSVAGEEDCRQGRVRRGRLYR